LKANFLGAGAHARRSDEQGGRGKASNKAGYYDDTVSRALLGIPSWQGPIFKERLGDLRGTGGRYPACRRQGENRHHRRKAASDTLP
jgi:hypothetical protein